MSVSSKMTNIANKIRSLLGITGKLGLDAMDTNLESANTEVATQEELMEEILTTLAEKSANTGETAKPEQEKTVDITENGTTEVLPDSGKVLSKVTVNVEVESGGGSDDNILQYATLNNGSLFREAVFPESYHAIVRFKGNTSNVLSNMLFAYSNVEKVTIGVENTPTNGVNISSWFAGCKKIKEITFENDTLKVVNLAATFNDCILLESVIGELDMSNCPINGVNNAFVKCYALKEIRFVENSIKPPVNFVDCTALSDDTIQSIIDGLVDLTGATSQNLIFDTSIKNALTETQITTITSKNWTLA